MMIGDLNLIKQLIIPRTEMRILLNGVILNISLGGGTLVNPNLLITDLLIMQMSLPESSKPTSLNLFMKIGMYIFLFDVEFS